MAIAKLRCSANGGLSSIVRGQTPNWCWAAYSLAFGALLGVSAYSLFKKLEPSPFGWNMSGRNFIGDSSTTPCVAVKEYVFSSGKISVNPAANSIKAESRPFT